MKDLYKSPRFWLIVIIAFLQALAVFSVLGGEQVDKLINIISVALAGVVAVRTVDRSADKKVVSAQITAGVPVDPPSSPSI